VTAPSGEQITVTAGNQQAVVCLGSTAGKQTDALDGLAGVARV
jgi:hypothetical protein